MENKLPWLEANLLKSMLHNYTNTDGNYGYGHYSWLEDFPTALTCTIQV